MLNKRKLVGLTVSFILGIVGGFRLRRVSLTKATLYLRTLIFVLKKMYIIMSKK